MLKDKHDFKLRGNIQLNYWNGFTSLQFIGQDIAPESIKSKALEEMETERENDEVER